MKRNYFQGSRGLVVILAKAGIQWETTYGDPWIPAFAGLTASDGSIRERGVLH